MRVAVTGATGFIGRRIIAALLARGDDVVALCRHPERARLPSSVRVVAGDVIAGGDWSAALADVDAAIHLAGEPVVGRWTRARKQHIEETRVGGTQHVVAALQTGRARVLVSASAIGYYGPHGDEELDEETPPGDDFLATVCRAWESAAQGFAGAGRRAVSVRTGVVLGDGGGALAKMIPPFRAFVGGPIGSGAQWVSWIHLDDLARLFLFALDDARVSGALNATAPAPVTMKALAAAIGHALGRPSRLPVPAFALKLMFGEGATVLLDGQRVLPKKALALGFRFEHGALDDALGDLLRRAVA